VKEGKEKKGRERGRRYRRAINAEGTMNAGEYLRDRLMIPLRAIEGHPRLSAETGAS
jgi:hypothetical protein